MPDKPKIYKCTVTTQLGHPQKDNLDNIFARTKNRPSAVLRDLVTNSLPTVTFDNNFWFKTIEGPSLVKHPTEVLVQMIAEKLGLEYLGGNSVLLNGQEYEINLAPKNGLAPTLTAAQKIWELTTLNSSDK